MRTIWLAVSVMLSMYLSFPAAISAKDKNFGEISLQIDQADSINMDVQMAFLYRKVSIRYDSTILIQNPESSKVLLYPQVSKGKENVLRIIIGKIDDKNPTFFDMFVVLGDTVTDSISWKGERNKIYITYNGVLKAKETQTEDINGYVVLERNKNGEYVAGSIKLGLSVALFNSQELANRLFMRGSFDLAVGDFRELTVGQNISDIEKKQKKSQNLYLAIVFTVFLIAIFGFR
ncbi:MAG: hypothetical protein JSW33_07750 [bacterium]|nr:MAG: hypothetical protein JSW33_07750 [bacterium]